MPYAIGRNRSYRHPGGGGGGCSANAPHGIPKHHMESQSAARNPKASYGIPTHPVPFCYNRSYTIAPYGIQKCPTKSQSAPRNLARTKASLLVVPSVRVVFACGTFMASPHPHPRWLGTSKVHNLFLKTQTIAYTWETNQHTFLALASPPPPAPYALAQTCLFSHLVPPPPPALPGSVFQVQCQW